MSPMLEGWVLPRLRDRGLGEARTSVTLRLAGIGESTVADRLGEALLRRQNPVVATYARSDAVDVRVSARDEGERPAAQLVEEAVAAVMAAVGEHVWGYGNDTWPGVLGRALSERGWTLALAERGTGGSLAELLGEEPWRLAARAAGGLAESDVGRLAELTRVESGATVGLAVDARESDGDTQVAVAASGPWGLLEATRTAFLGGEIGRRRAAIQAAVFLNDILRGRAEVPSGQRAPGPLADNSGPGTPTSPRRSGS
jgi:hypothetical protein